MEEVLIPYPINLELTDADTEYSVTLPANCKFFTMQCRDGTEIRYSWTTGKVATSVPNFMTSRENAAVSAPNKIDVHSAFRTVYFACGSAAKVVEILAYVSGSTPY